MVNNCRMDRAKVGRLQGPIVGYAGDSTLVYYSAPYDSLYLDDASLSEIQFDVVYDYVLVRHICNFPMYMCDLCMCVSQYMDYVLDNLRCSNSKNLYVPMFLPILYDVFHHFSSMLPIIYVQSIYNLIKPVTTCCMIFFLFSQIFLGTVSKTVEIGFVQNRSSKPENRSIY
jgi:hypothetical protein